MDSASEAVAEPRVDSPSETETEPPDNQPPIDTDDPVSSEPTVERPLSWEQTMARPSSSSAALLDVPLEMQLGEVLLQEEDVVHSSLLPYLCWVASLLEGRTISRHELLAALLKRMRQRSIGQLPHRAYVRSYWNQHPP
jgi:hypothetical protein